MSKSYFQVNVRVHPVKYDIVDDSKTDEFVTDIYYLMSPFDQHYLTGFIRVAKP